MRLVRASALAGVVVMAWACGNGTGGVDPEFATFGQNVDDAGSATKCKQGDTASCTCENGASGTQACTSAGTLAACVCAAEATSLGDAAAARCGNATCESGESCKTCPSDCGECPKCDLAPSCSDGLALPSQTSSLAFEALSTPLAAPTTDAGAVVPNKCLDAQLRMRISRIEVEHQGKMVWLPTGTLRGSPATYYCVVQASDGVVLSSGGDAGANGSVEVALTRPTAEIPDYSGADFAPADSIFWGQQGPRLTRNNLTVTYSCFQQKETGDSTWQTVLDAGSKAAGTISHAGPYGWAFGLGSVGLAVAGAAVGAAQQQGDWHMFDVTQTIDRSRLLDLANGRRWSFTRSGGDSAFHYPWSITLHVESWGCAEALPPPAR